MQLHAHKAELHFVLDVPESARFAEVADTRLRQVIYILQSNAIKFTDLGGTITLR
ncbi:MAG: hypothetical protein JWM91_3583 [Rhodospirillales bacterium]|nr:hypothetical protein [Rhodospirillales bacterium]